MGRALFSEDKEATRLKVKEIRERDARGEITGDSDYIKKRLAEERERQKF